MKLVVVAIVALMMISGIDALRVASVQMTPLDNSTGHFATAMDNANFIATVAANYSNQVDLIVFPEYALYGSYSMDSACSQNGNHMPDGFCEVVGVAGDTVNCELAGSSMLSAIACGPAASQTTVSYNACEMVPANATHGTEYFNTQVVVKGGVILAKYRKYHVWAKKCFNSPSLEVVKFQVQNTTFGLFTCFDILFKDPKQILVDEGVKFFSYSSAIPLIARDAVKLFSWTNGVTVVNSNLQSGQTSVIQKGTTLSDCSGQSGLCVAIADV